MLRQMKSASAYIKEFQPFRLDTVNQCLWRRREGEGDEQIDLAPKTFSVLCYLVERAGRLVTEAELLEAVWAGIVVQPEAVKGQLYKIRGVLGDSPKAPRFIETLPRRGYRFIAPVHEAVEADSTAPAKAASRLVGRDRALSELRESLHAASKGHRQIVFVTGEPGIGKTALVDEFVRTSRSEVPGVRVACGQCIEARGSTEPYYPMLAALGGLCQGRSAASIIQTLAMDAPTWLVQFPWLLNDEHRKTLHQEILGTTRERMLREIAAALETMAADVPLLLVFEDLQWADPSTLDLISVVARGRLPAKLIVIATIREVDTEPAQLLPKYLVHDLLMRRLCRAIDLRPLSVQEVAAYLVEGSYQDAVPEALASMLHRQSGGNPLFLREALDRLGRLGLIRQEKRRLSFPSQIAAIDVGVPESVRVMIEARMKHLSEGERRALEAASTVGTVFTAHDVAKACGGDPGQLGDLYDELAHRGRLVRFATSGEPTAARADTCYEFVLNLYREVLRPSATALRDGALWHLLDGIQDSLGSEEIAG
jgi:DNA-binding winged helix-turn-helix (wHTH) protein